MRNRERNVVHEGDYSYSVDHSRSDHDTSEFSGIGAAHTVSFDRMTDVVTPRYHERSAKGEVIVSPMHKHVYDASITSSEPFSIYHKGDECTHNYSNSERISKTLGIMGSTNSTYVDLTRPKSLASTSAWADVNSGIFQGAVFLGELRETLGFLRNPLNSLTRQFKKDHKRVPKGTNLHQFYADNWLAMRYGLRPLIKDYQDALDAVDSLRKPLPDRFTARGYSAVNVTVPYYAETDVSIFGCKAEGIITQEGSVRTGILYQVDNRNTFGLSLHDIPIAAWELIPYSFVVDWFLNTGSYISAITPRIGVKVLGSWTTTQIETESDVFTTIQSLGGSTYDLVSSGGYRSRIKRRILSRKPGVSSPELLAQNALSDMDLGTDRLIDIMSLARRILMIPK